MNIKPNSETTIEWTAAQRIADDVVTILAEYGADPVDPFDVLASAAGLYFPAQRGACAITLGRRAAKGRQLHAALALRAYGEIVFETVNGSSAHGS